MNFQKWYRLGLKARAAGKHKDQHSAWVAVRNKPGGSPTSGIRIEAQQAFYEGFHNGRRNAGGTSTASRTATRTATEATTTGNKTSTSTGGASTSGGNVSISVKHNPARVARGKAVTLRNMALVTIRRLPGGAVAVTGRKLAGR